MKRFLIAIAVAACAAAVTFAAPRRFYDYPRGLARWTFDGGAGLFYDQSSLPPGAIDAAPPSYNLRGEIFGDFTYHVNSRFGLGWETGLGFFPSTLSVGGASQSYMQFDIPVRLFILGQAGPFFLQPLGGLFLWDASPALPGNQGSLGTGVELGARAGIGGPFFRLYAEASYVMGPTSFPRFGFGGMARLFRF